MCGLFGANYGANYDLIGIVISASSQKISGESVAMTEYYGNISVNIITTQGRAMARINQRGIVFELKALTIDASGNTIPFNLSDASAVQIQFEREDHSTIAFDAVSSLEDSDWFVRYSNFTGSSILDQTGYWQMRILAALNSGEFVPFSKYVFYVENG